MPAEYRLKLVFSIRTHRGACSARGPIFFLVKKQVVLLKAVD